MTRHSMEVNGLRIGVHYPPKDPHRGRRLAPLSPHAVHRVSDYKECPDAWPRAGVNEGSFFIGTDPNHEMWLDFRDLNQLDRFAAVVISVQRVNAVSGRRVDDVFLEQYRENCPLHQIPFRSDRLCTECGYKWPSQNYVTNAAGPSSSQNFWLDGWRTHDGEIAQFVFTDTEAGLGIAQQLIGADRSVAIGIAVFLSKDLKPVPPPMPASRRGGGFIDTHLEVTAFAATKGGYGDGLLGANLSNDVIAAHVDDAEPDMEAIDSFSPTRSMSRIGAPVRQEVSAGRSVDQEVYADPHDLSFWQDQPAAVFMLTPADRAWVETVTRNGPNTADARGFLKDLKTAG